MNSTRATHGNSVAVVDRRRPATRSLCLCAAGIALSVILAAPSAAVQISSDQVVVPVVAHLPGNNGTQWRSDVWIQSPSINVLNITLSYYPVSGGMLTATTHLESYHGAYLHDIVFETFGLDNSKGMLIVEADAPSVEVRARVYNTGNPDGEFGQAVPGLPIGRLGRQGYLSGLTTAAGTRLSVGVANPTGESYSVLVNVYDATTREKLTEKRLDLGPYQLVQLDRVADLWGLPARGAVYITVDSAQNTWFFYAYASVVRNDTGDATFIFGTTPNTGPQ